MAERLRNGGPTWDHIIPLLIGFHRIVSLDITLFGQYLDSTNPEMWSTLGNNFSGVVSLSLSNLFFTDASDFAQAVCAFPCLRKLIIRDVINSTSTEMFESELPPATTFRLPPDLHTFNLGIVGTDAVLMWWLSFPTRPALRTVRTHRVRVEDLAMIQKFIGALGNDLLSFTITTEDEDCKLPNVILMMNLRAVLTTTPVTLHSIDMTSLKNLRFIRLALQRGYPADQNRWVTRMLSQISSVHLEDVVLELCPFTSSIMYDLDTALEWSEVDAILQHSTFTRLRNVELQSTTWDKAAPILDPMFHAQAIERLPQCHARGILSCVLR
jgi:hypothetical protein